MSLKGKQNPRYTKKERCCLQCFENFLVFNYRTDDQKRGKFCSKKCYWENMKGRNLPEDTIAKIIEGQSHKEVKDKMLITAFKKGHVPQKPFSKGHLPWNTGKKRPEITGVKHYNWKGGKSSENELMRKSFEYRLWREAIFTRDDFTCQECHIRGSKLHAHHIKPFSLFPELRLAIDNGVTLCVDCHKKTETYGFKIFDDKKIYENS